MSANVAKDLAREALLYDELGHRREAKLLLIHGKRVCPEAQEIERVAAKLLAAGADHAIGTVAELPALIERLEHEA